MLDLPFCFGEYGVQVADSFVCGKTLTQQNVVTCLYRIRLSGVPRLLTVTWCAGQALSLNLHNSIALRVDSKPWLLTKKKGSKSFEVEGSKNVDVFWDLSSAKYGSGPDPLGEFFLAMVYEQEIVLLLGDVDEAQRKTQSRAKWPPAADIAMVSRREHIFGKRFYTTKAQFGDSGRIHDITIECTTREREPRLCIRIDKQLVLQVKRLLWKFRGNQTILVDGFPIELFWDVHNWLFSPINSHAAFMFQSCPAASEKSWSSLASSDSRFHWHHMSISSSEDSKDPESGAFSLLLYAWKSA